MSVSEVDHPDMPLEPVTQVPRPVTDKPTRERSEHPDRTPRESSVHPATQVRGRDGRRERIGAG